MRAVQRIKNNFKDFGGLLLHVEDVDFFKEYFNGSKNLDQK